MVSMSTTFDRALDVVRGRTAILAGIAGLGIVVPGLVRDAVTAFLAPGSVGFAALGAVATIAAAVVGLLAQLALLAVATDPAVDAGEAWRRASARLPASIGVTVVIGLVLVLAALPPVIAIAASGADLTQMGTPAGMESLGRGTSLFLLLYMLLLIPLGLFAMARLSPVNAVVLNERRGLGAIARAFALTRGLTWRLVGVVLLYLIVVGVAALAAQFVAGAVFSLLLGRGSQAALFLTAAVTGVVAAGFSVLASAFVAQLYVAVTQRGVATVFE